MQAGALECANSSAADVGIWAMFLNQAALVSSPGLEGGDSSAACRVLVGEDAV